MDAANDGNGRNVNPNNRAFQLWRQGKRPIELENSDTKYELPDKTRKGILVEMKGLIHKFTIESMPSVTTLNQQQIIG